jgi:hypothetical protein
MELYIRLVRNNGTTIMDIDFRHVQSGIQAKATVAVVIWR